MGDTLLQMIQAVCNEVGLTAPTSVVGNTDQQILQLLALANREGREMVTYPGGWPQLRGEQTITLVNGQAAYNFPTDFQSYIPATIWDRTQRWTVQGPLSPQEWQYLKSGLINIMPYQRYRIMSGQLYFDPTPNSTYAGQTIAIEYMSKSFCLSSAGTPQSKWLADTDTFRLLDDILVLGVKWRFLAAKRMDYSEEKAAYEAAVEREHASAFGERTVPLNAGQYHNFLGDPAWNVGDGNFPGRV